MNAIQQLLTDHIDVWTAADTGKKSGRGRVASNAGSVYGIKKLRQLILELAVRGKLVPQDANDEPASELLKRIQAEKAKLVLDGKIKKSKPLPTISEKEKLFKLPHGWEWIKFGDVYSFEYGNNLPSEQRTNSGEYPVYGSNGVVGTHDICFVNSPCIVVGRKGSAGALNLCLSQGCCVTDVAYYCLPPKHLDLIFSFKLFHTLGLDFLGKGIKPGLNRNEAYDLPIAVPPLDEQHRIVAKVDELMALCDQMETQHTDVTDAHEKLVSHLLGTLNQSQNAEDFSSNWQRIAAHFATLFTTEVSIDALKQTLLQLAVMGKLVKFICNEDVTNVRSVNYGVSKFATISATLPIWPKHWGLKSLTEVSEAVIDCPHSTPKWTAEGMVCVRTSQFRPGQLDLSDVQYVSEETYQERILRLEPKENDILYSREGGILGVACRVPQGVKLCLGQRMMLIRTGADISPIFLEMLLNSPLITSIAREMTTGGAAPRVNVSTVKAYPTPLPPLEEQHLIIAKVDKLMALCERMKTCINDSSQLQRKVADVMVKQAMA
jgi:type I restriction enzyme, S subunit